MVDVFDGLPEWVKVIVFLAILFTLTAALASAYVEHVLKKRILAEIRERRKPVVLKLPSIEAFDKVVDDMLDTPAERVNGMYEFTKALPKYHNNEPVGALKIASMERCNVGRFSWVWKLHFEEPGYSPFMVEDNWVKMHNATSGGYMVQRASGYVTFLTEAEFKQFYSKEVSTSELLGFSNLVRKLRGYALRRQMKNNI